MPPEGSQEASNVKNSNDCMMQANFESHEGSTIKDAEAELMKIPDKEEEEMNYFTDTQITLTQPAIFQSYDRFDHFFTLNFEAMTPDCLFSQGSPKDDPTNEFEIEQQYENKEKVIMAVKMYSIRRVVEYKILKSGQLKYIVYCTQFGFGC
ncbi:hypothetical protein AHAS_Ahas13G0386500 [Arachis hypogaea]